MSDETRSSPASIAQELGADPDVSVVPQLPRDAVQPLTFSGVLRDLTRAYPLAMLGIAFLAGVAYVGGRRRR
jgi:hypothetical protein